MSTGKVLIGVVVGVAVGALLGVLFAHDKGLNTRKKISKKGEDFVDGLKEKCNEFLEDISEKFEGVKEDASGFAKKARTKPE